MRKEKTLHLDPMASFVEGSQSLILTSYQKMDANTTADFRTALRQAGGTLTVVKKRMFLKAAASLGYNFTQELDGHLAVIGVKEGVIDAAKTLYKFKKQTENMIQVLGGQFEGKLCTAQEIEMISNLPTQDEMRAQFIAVLEAPMSHTLSVIEEMLKTFEKSAESTESQESSLI